MNYKVKKTVTVGWRQFVAGSIVELDKTAADGMGSEYLEQVDAPEDFDNAVDTSSNKQITRSKKKN